MKLIYLSNSTALLGGGTQPSSNCGISAAAANAFFPGLRLVGLFAFPPPFPRCHFLRCRAVADQLWYPKFVWGLAVAGGGGHTRGGGVEGGGRRLVDLAVALNNPCDSLLLIVEE
jgi:hypothetical protein